MGGKPFHSVKYLAMRLSPLFLGDTSALGHLRGYVGIQAFDRVGLALLW
jgi:hypothetical protein